MSFAQDRSPDDGSDDPLLSESFNRRTLLDMEVALDRACSALPPDARHHANRTFMAARMIERVRAGACTQDAMIRAALEAAEELKTGGRDRTARPAGSPEA